MFYWGLGMGDWGLGIGDWAQSPIPNPHPQNCLLFFNNIFCIFKLNLSLKIIIYYK